jgi:hypothetical protein
MELFKASRQWAERPPDQRFQSLDELHAVCAGYRGVAATATVPYRALKAVPQGQDVILENGNSGAQGQLTHWAFGQLCQRAGAPASYLRELPATLAAECLNTGLHARPDDDQAQVLVHRPNGTRLIRAFTSTDYTRIWNSDVTERLGRLAERGSWRPAPAAMDGSRGLYASDHDMFAFLVDNGRRVFEKLPGGGLSRGFFVWNSEVGAASFGVCTFLYEYVCGNHIVWGAKGVRELRVRHVGDADNRAFHELSGQLRIYAESSASEDEARIQRATTFSLGRDKEEVLDRVFGLRVPQLSRKRTDEAYQLAEAHADWYGDPRTAWGIANGITELAKALPYTDDRVALDRAAGKVLEVAF